MESVKESTPRPSGAHYWRSLDELTERPEFKTWLHREFPQGASEVNGVNRRGFLKVMAASFGLAGFGVTGCRRPEIVQLPYSRQPENSIPGNPYYYATSFPDAWDNEPIIAETYQHRPVHLEGNLGYEPYRGTIKLRAQASILDLYDPDRMVGFWRGTRRQTAQAVQDMLAGTRAKYQPVGGQGLAFLAAPSTSPTRQRVLANLREVFPQAVWAEYAPGVNRAVEEAVRLLYGQPGRPVYDLARARRIVTLDADFCKMPGGLALARGFAAGRQVANQAEARQMNRLYAIEAAYTMTGAMADHRLRLAASYLPTLSALLVARLLRLSGADASLERALRERLPADPAPDGWLDALAEDLWENRGAAVVVAGSHLPLEVQIMALGANRLLEANRGPQTIVQVPGQAAATIEALAEGIRAGQVETLFVLGGNPGYNAPTALGWAELQRKVPEVIRHGYYFDETALDADLTIAASHYLESWSDGRTWDGTYVPVQPTIYPLYESLSELEILAGLAGLPATDPYTLVQQTFAEVAGVTGDTRGAFATFLAQGYLSESGFTRLGGEVSTARAREVIAEGRWEVPELSAGNLEVVLTLDSKLGDGASANNGWLQECPDPMTKLTWDNAIHISPRLAVELGYDTKSGEFRLPVVGKLGGIAKRQGTFQRGEEQAPVFTLTVGGQSVTGPVMIQPGLPDWTVVVPLGYGRTKGGRIAEGTGFNGYPLLAKEGGYALVGGRLEGTGLTHKLANTQEHWSMEGRDLYREATVETYLEDAHWVAAMGMESHTPPIYREAVDMPRELKALETPRGNSLYEHPDFGGPNPTVEVWQTPEGVDAFVPLQQWGMTIDLNTCLGCGTCIVACQSENNIPIVGKDQVLRGREMHWFRLDRYFATGDVERNQVELPADPQAVVMPVLCMHCETAPCEQVCPVNATVHDEEGLNVMAYNRCVGTRYCSNNCPYKVRRFNFFDYNKRSINELYLGPVGPNINKTEEGELRAMRHNPDVTVRMRGVMEKCTFCVQRIQEAKIAQKVVARDSNNVRVPDGVIRTACQRACPTGAIVFGDVSDPETAVSKSKANDRNYSLLGYLNTRPRLTYLGRLRNPNPRIPGAYTMPLTTREYYGDESKMHGSGHGHEAGHAHDDAGHATEAVPGTPAEAHH